MVFRALALWCSGSFNTHGPLGFTPGVPIYTHIIASLLYALVYCRLASFYCRCAAHATRYHTASLRQVTTNVFTSKSFKILLRGEFR